MFIRSPQVCAVFTGRGGEGWGVRNKKRAYLCFFLYFQYYSACSGTKSMLPAKIIIHS